MFVGKNSIYVDISISPSESLPIIQETEYHIEHLCQHRISEHLLIYNIRTTTGHNCDLQNKDSNSFLLLIKKLDFVNNTHTMAIICVVCARGATIQCATCHIATYCNEQHFRCNWGHHKLICQMPTVLRYVNAAIQLARHRRKMLSDTAFLNTEAALQNMNPDALARLRFVESTGMPATCCECNKYSGNFCDNCNTTWCDNCESSTTHLTCPVCRDLTYNSEPIPAAIG